MNNALLPVVIGLLVGFIAGIFAVRASEKREPLYGGMPAKVFHYLGASLFIAALPSALLELITGQGFGTALVASFSLFGLSLIVLFIYAIFERPALARRQPANEGWTEEKARASGL